MAAICCRHLCGGPRQLLQFLGRNGGRSVRSASVDAATGAAARRSRTAGLAVTAAVTSYIVYKAATTRSATTVMAKVYKKMRLL